MTDKPDKNEIKAELDRLTKQVEVLRVAAKGQAVPLPMLSMVRALAAREKEQSTSAAAMAVLLSKAGTRDNYGDYLDAWKQLFSLAVPAIDNIFRMRNVQGEIIADTACRGFERGVMSFARYPLVARNIRPPAQAWQVFNAGLIDCELRTAQGAGQAKIDLLGGKAVAVAVEAELQAVWNALDSYATRMPKKGEFIRKMALLWRGGSLAEIVVSFRITSEEISRRLSELHSDLRKRDIYSLKDIEKIEKEQALNLLRLISQSYRFLPVKPGRNCPDNVEIALVAAGLAENPVIEGVERHMLSCSGCVRKIIEMAETTAATVKLPLLDHKTEDALWSRIEAFINLWNGKRAILHLSTLTLTVDAKPAADGLSVMLRSTDKQPFRVEIEGHRVLDSKKGEVEMSVSAPVTIRVRNEKMIVGAFDLPDNIQNK